MDFDYSSMKKRFNVYLNKKEFDDFIYLRDKFEEDSLNGTFLKMLALYVAHYKRKEQESLMASQEAVKD